MFEEEGVWWSAFSVFCVFSDASMNVWLCLVLGTRAEGLLGTTLDFHSAGVATAGGDVRLALLRASPTTPRADTCLRLWAWVCPRAFRRRQGQGRSATEGGVGRAGGVPCRLQDGLPGCAPTRDRRWQ